VAVYTDDVEHDDVGMPGGPLIGKEAARRFHKELSDGLEVEVMRPLRRYHGQDFCVTERNRRGVVARKRAAHAGPGS
jgi:hypothetical protein